MKKIIIIFICFFAFFFIKTENTNKSYFLNKKFLTNFGIAILTVYLGYKYDASRNQLHESIYKFGHPFYSGELKESAFIYPQYDDFKKNEINLCHLFNLKKEIDENLKKGFYSFHKIEINGLKKDINQWIEVNQFFKDQIEKDEKEIINLDNKVNCEIRNN